MKINIAKLDKAAVLCALYDNARPLGMGFLHYTPEPMKLDEAKSLLERQTYFDYLKGRVMKVDLRGDEVDTWLYDRDNGQGTGQAAIEAVK